MKPTNKTYRKFQELILKSEGKTLEDELIFGCRIKGNYSTPELRYLGEDKEYLTHGLVFPDGELLIVDKIKLSEILGQDITLERVLRALERNALFDYHKPKTTTLNDTEDDILKYFVNYRGDLWHEGMGWIAKWQLCKPAHLQEEETLLKLIEILS